MKMPIDPEGIDPLVDLMKGYVRDPTEDNLRRIHKKMDIIGETIDWARSYLEQLESTGNENGLKTRAQNFLYYAANLGHETLGAIKLDKLKKKWKVKLPHLNTTPLLWEDKLYVGSDFGQFYCFDKNTGEMKWQIQAEGGIYGLPAELNGMIFFTDVKGNIYSIAGNTVANPAVIRIIMVITNHGFRSISFPSAVSIAH